MSHSIDKNIKIKKDKEKEIVLLMIMKYCKGNKHLSTLCESCSKLIEYVNDRVDNCPFAETKTFCSFCEIHCYEKNMQEEIKKVMRYSGSRMIFSNPIITLDHVFQGIKYKLNNNK